VKAIVLCAGYGTRLGDLTREIPKAMLPLAGRPLLEYTIEYLAAQGCDDLAVNLHFCPEQIESYFGDGRRLGVRIHYSCEPQLLGTAGAIKELAPWLADADDFLVIYGDILTDQDLAPLWQVQQRHGALATLLLHQRPGSNSLVQMDQGGRITAFLERPSQPQRKACPFPWVNSVVQVLHRRILAYIPAGQVLDLPRDVYAKVVSSEKIYGVPLSGYRCAIDSAARYEEAQAAIREGRYQPALRHRVG
jgi:NDP-sugar pyrophosphorylase family protein